MPGTTDTGLEGCPSITDSMSPRAILGLLATDSASHLLAVVTAGAVRASHGEEATEAPPQPATEPPPQPLDGDPGNISEPATLSAASSLSAILSHCQSSSRTFREGLQKWDRLRRPARRATERASLNVICLLLVLAFVFELAVVSALELAIEAALDLDPAPPAFLLDLTPALEPPALEPPA
mmetsp:Transcript_32284/g.63936  ORF Transcript_32284/g.63936 Transcript_32284/m.63936 type:complete len:181 (-) Transcript_32284:773-1315(-)